MSAVEIPYAALPDSTVAFAPAGPERAIARLELNRDGIVEVASGIRGFKLLRLGGSAFHGFVRDQYTTLPDIKNRPLHMWLDLEWLYAEPRPASARAPSRRAVRRIVHDVFQRIRIRQHSAGDLSDRRQDAGGNSRIAEVHLEANNRTWDTMVERGEEVGVFTEARPPFGFSAYA